MNSKNPHKHTGTTIRSAVEKAEDILGWIEGWDGKRVPAHIAEFAELEKQGWWQRFRECERRATKAAFDKLAEQGVTIHKQSRLCHLVEGKETPAGFEVEASSEMAPQLLTSPLNIKCWRQDHRLLRHLFKLYLKKTANVRFFTLPWGPVKLADLGPAISALHERIGWLANREWLKEAGLQFVLRKTELPLFYAGEEGNEEAFLHAHIAVLCRRRLGKSKWEGSKKRLTEQWGRDYPAHDAGEIRDEETQPNYLFKNPLASHEQDPDDPEREILTYEPLERLTPKGTKDLYEALKGKRLCEPMGDFAKFKSAMEASAEKEGKTLRLKFQFQHGQISTKLLKVPKKPKKPPGSRPVEVKDMTVANLGPGKRIVRGYSGAKRLPPLSSAELETTAKSPRTPAPKLVATRWLIRRTAQYIPRLGRKKFKTRQIEIPSPIYHHRYDHHLINLALARIPWLKPAGNGRGEWRKWTVNTRHPNFPGWQKAKRKFPKDSLPSPKRTHWVPLAGDAAFAPGRYDAVRLARRKVKQDKYNRTRREARAAKRTARV